MRGSTGFPHQHVLQSRPCWGWGQKKPVPRWERCTRESNPRPFGPHSSWEQKAVPSWSSSTQESNLRPQNTSKPSDAVLYFAYGANMSAAKLRQRGVQPFPLSPAQVADPGTCLGFSHRNGFATLVALDALGGDLRYMYRQPHGVLYRISPGDLDTLKAAEQGYYLCDVTVTPYRPLPQPSAPTSSLASQNPKSAAAVSGERPKTGQNLGAQPGGRTRGHYQGGVASPPDGEGEGGPERLESVRAVAFFSNPWVLLGESLPPRERYLTLLRVGARENGLAGDYLNWLDELESVPAGRMLGREYQDSLQDKALTLLGVSLGLGFTATWLARMQ